MKKNKKTKFRMYFSFILTVLFTILILKAINWLPSTFLKEDIRKFRTLDDVKTKLRVSKIYVPAYFPEHIQWPPSEIFAQKKPYLLIIMHFSHTDSRNLAMSLYQTDKKSGFEQPLDILYQKDEREVKIKDRTGALLLAVCRGNVRCNRLSWEESNFKITIVSDDTPEQIIKMAESTFHE